MFSSLAVSSAFCRGYIGDGEVLAGEYSGAWLKCALAARSVTARSTVDGARVDAPERRSGTCEDVPMGGEGLSDAHQSGGISAMMQQECAHVYRACAWREFLSYASVCDLQEQDQGPNVSSGEAIASSPTSDRVLMGSTAPP